MAVASFSKTDVRYWSAPGRLKTRTNQMLHAEISFGGTQKKWPLKTANREQAAIKARDIWLSLQKHGLEATVAKFKPWTVIQKKEADLLTVGAYIKAAKAVSTVRPATFTTYERKLRFLVSQIAKIKGTSSRHDYVHGGATKWREKIDGIPLANLRPQIVMQWRTRYVSRFDEQPAKRASAQQTAASILRSAKALFAPRIVRNLGLDLPKPLPFDGVDLGKRPRVRYKSKVNAPLLAVLAHSELKDNKPELFKIFLLAFGAGMRRSEIDRLTWPAFNWTAGTVLVESSEYGTVKTDSSADTIDIAGDLAEYFKAQMPKSKTGFVISSRAAPTAAPHWNRYRCDGHFKALLTWLREKGVTARNPLHTLRKEFGSLINQKFGIFAASAALRHSNISITREAYIDRKERIALDMSEIVASGKRNAPKPDNQLNLSFGDEAGAAEVRA